MNGALLNIRWETAWAGTGFVAVGAYYLAAREAVRQGQGWLWVPSAFPATDSRFWTSRRYLLGGIALSLLFLGVSGGLAAHRQGESWGWGLLCAAFAGIAFTTLVPGFIYLARHWMEFLQDAAGEKPTDPERYAWAAWRGPLAKKTMWVFAGFALLVSGLEKLGYTHPSDNVILRVLYEHVLWIAIFTLLVIVWTSKGVLALLLRFALLLFFSAVLTLGSAAFLYWVARQTIPTLVVLLAAMLSLNFVFYTLLEHSHSGFLVRPQHSRN